MKLEKTTHVLNLADLALVNYCLLKRYEYFVNAEITSDLIEEFCSQDLDGESRIEGIPHRRYMQSIDKGIKSQSIEMILSIMLDIKDSLTFGDINTRHRKIVFLDKYQTQFLSGFENLRYLFGEGVNI